MDILNYHNLVKPGEELVNLIEISAQMRSPFLSRGHLLRAKDRV